MVEALNVRVRKTFQEAKPLKPSPGSGCDEAVVTPNGPRLCPLPWKASLHLSGAVPEVT